MIRGDPAGLRTLFVFVHDWLPCSPSSTVANVASAYAAGAALALSDRRAGEQLIEIYTTGEGGAALAVAIQGHAQLLREVLALNPSGESAEWSAS